ncbi:MAG TPA: TSUP family transporter [Verrucomicrobiae bacterium]|nr:TSUP family transporter [Verrucomicrobiae bacterium]
MNAITVLYLALGIVAVVFAVAVVRSFPRHHVAPPRWIEIGIGAVTNFFDTLGVGSFAPTVSLFKFFKLVPDEKIPGTLNVGHTLPTITEALIFIAIIGVDPLTLVSLIAAAVAGAWLGAGVVSRWPRRNVQIGMGIALAVAALIFVMKTKQVNLFPSSGGSAIALAGVQLWIGIAVNFCLGALMTIGIGLYAPCFILVSFLGMDIKAAFPIMMGSCAFLMPIASMRFVKFDAYSLRASFGLSLGGVPAVLIAALIVKSMDINVVEWLVVAVVLYAAIMMLRSAFVERNAPAAVADYSATPGT